VKRREVLIATLIGVIPATYLALVGYQTGSLAWQAIDVLGRNWYVGVGLLAVAIGLALVQRTSLGSRSLGVIGLAWVTFLACYIVMLFVVVLQVPRGI
jgi:hypothetical protein